MTKSPEPPDHDLHGEWSPDSQRALDELDKLIELTHEFEHVERRRADAEQRFVAAMVFIPDYEKVALKTEARSRVEASVKRCEEARKA